MPVLQSLRRFFSKPAVDPAVAEFYRACIEAARQVPLYNRMGVPDTVDGRFDALLIHVLLVMRRLGANIDSKQELFDLMFADMDRNLREMGVGDMGIGKRVKPMIEAFYGRGQAYEKAIDEGDDELGQALQRNLYGAKLVTPAELQAIVGYVNETVALLDSQNIDDLLSGRIRLITLP